MSNPEEEWFDQELDPENWPMSNPEEEWFDQELADLATRGKEVYL